MLGNINEEDTVPFLMEEPHGKTYSWQSPHKWCIILFSPPILCHREIRHQWKGEYIYLFFLFLRWYSDPASKSFVEERYFQVIFKNLEHLCTLQLPDSPCPGEAEGQSILAAARLLSTQHKFLPLEHSVNICRLTEARKSVRIWICHAARWAGGVNKTNGVG